MERMMSSDFVVDVDERNFEYEVISYSQNIPVVVDFWAEWCRPCKQLGPLLERLAQEYQGSFRLARVDIDRSPNLALRYGVRSIPTVKAISQGEVVGQFTGVIPEARLREFLSQITPPSPAHLMLEKATSLMSDQRWEEAAGLLDHLLGINPQDAEARLGRLRAHLGLGEIDVAHALLTDFPTSRQYGTAWQMMPYIRAAQQYRAGGLPEVTELDIAMKNSLRLALKGNFLAALDGMLDILRQNKRYGNGAGREIILALLALLGDDNPDVPPYRAELASILF
jgi:putative thioredoxin